MQEHRRSWSDRDEVRRPEVSYLYCLGITSIDPIRYQLLFERFLNPERVSMPDIDVDFCFERRQEVIDYVEENMVKTAWFRSLPSVRLAARGVIRDVGRVHGPALCLCGQHCKDGPTGAEYHA